MVVALQTVQFLREFLMKNRHEKPMLTNIILFLICFFQFSVAFLVIRPCDKPIVVAESPHDQENVINHWHSKGLIILPC